MTEATRTTTALRLGRVHDLSCNTHVPLNTRGFENVRIRALLRHPVPSLQGKKLTPRLRIQTSNMHACECCISCAGVKPHLIEVCAASIGACAASLVRVVRHLFLLSLSFPYLVLSSVASFSFFVMGACAASLLRVVRHLFLLSIISFLVSVISFLFRNLASKSCSAAARAHQAVVVNLVSRS